MPGVGSPGFYKKRGNFRPNPSGRKFNENADGGPGGDRRPRRGNFHGLKPEHADDNHNHRVRDRDEKPNRQHKTVAETLSELNFGHLRITEKAHIVSFVFSYAKIDYLCSYYRFQRFLMVMDVQSLESVLQKVKCALP